LNNQHLSRSNTPLQNQRTADVKLETKAVVSVFDAFGEIGTRKAPTPSLITGPTDFKDDPFKDYRYEDPFSIKDPFAEEGEEELSEGKGADHKRNFAEDFSSGGEYSAILGPIPI